MANVKTKQVNTQRKKNDMEWDKTRIITAEFNAVDYSNLGEGHNLEGFVEVAQEASGIAAD